jgi:molybdenum cofactor cytidylyltransferase
MAEPALTLGAILLAAGDSSRLGQPKQLLESARWSNVALVRRQAELLLNTGFAAVVVVTGSNRSAVEAALEGLSVQLCHNENWKRGMGTSIACGIRVMPERVRGTLLLLCDQWRVVDADLQNLCGEWGQHPTSAVVSKWSESSGPPAIFPRVLFDPLARLNGEKGAKRVLSRFSGEVRYLTINNAAYDIDVASDIPDQRI